MKKVTRKLLSVMLSLLLVLSVFTITASAAEVEDHVHTDECCADVSVTAACTHASKTYSYGTQYKYWSTTQHKVMETKTTYCTTCGYTVVTYTGNDSLAMHVYSLPGGAATVGCIYCGYEP